MLQQARLMVHVRIEQVTPPAICMQLLSLPVAAHPAVDRASIQQELLRACQNPPAHGGALFSLQLPQAIHHQASMPIMLGSLLHQASMPSFRQKVPEAADASGTVDALATMWMQPVRGTYSRFFGQSSPLDVPVLAPVPQLDGRRGVGPGHRLIFLCRLGLLLMSDALLVYRLGSHDQQACWVWGPACLMSPMTCRSVQERPGCSIPGTSFTFLAGS